MGEPEERQVNSLWFYSTLDPDGASAGWFQLFLEDLSWRTESDSQNPSGFKLLGLRSPSVSAGAGAAAGISHPWLIPLFNSLLASSVSFDSCVVVSPSVYLWRKAVERLHHPGLFSALSYHQPAFSLFALSVQSFCKLQQQKDSVAHPLAVKL